MKVDIICPFCKKLVIKDHTYKAYDVIHNHFRKSHPAEWEHWNETEKHILKIIADAEERNGICIGIYKPNFNGIGMYKR